MTCTNTQRSLQNDLPSGLRLTCVRSGRSLDHHAFSRAIEAKQTALAPYLDTAGCRIVICLRDPIDCLIALFAVWGHGACAVMVNPDIKNHERENVVASTGAAIWIDNEGTAPTHSAITHKDDIADAALILMTSGTTGVPKGVTHGITGLRARLVANVAEIGEDTLRNTLCTLPLFFGHGLIGNALSTLFAGQHLLLWPKLQLHELAAFGPTLDTHDITFFSSVPSFWRMVLSVSAAPQKPPKRVHVGSAPLSEQLWREIRDWCGTAHVFNTYGMTETANWIAGGAFDDPRRADGYVGHAWGGTLRVLRDNASHTAGQGEVLVKSPGQMLGFWRAPERTAADMFEGYLRTGDLGHLTTDGALTLVGRSKNEINVGGIKVLAEEVDMLLEKHPDVAEACSFGIPDKIAGERVGAIVRMKPASIDVAALLQWCRENARADAVPARIEIMTDIPKNDRGKIARMDIQKQMIAKWS